MTSEHPPQMVDLHRRAMAAVSALQAQASGATAPDLHHLALVRRIALVAALGGLGLFLGVIVLVSVFASGALPWLVGAVLAIAVGGVILLGVHAGGHHGLLLPLPVLVLAAVWAVTISAGSWSSPFAWVLAALVFLSALAAAVLIVPALAYGHAAPLPTGPSALLGVTGVALSALSPTGIARVNNETWTAESLSGPLPAGAPVHVAKVEGLRLLVWSETGDVPGAQDLGFINQERENS